MKARISTPAKTPQKKPSIHKPLVYFLVVGQQEKNSPFEIIFGDYDKAVAIQESWDIADDYFSTKIVKTTDLQKDHDKYIVDLNASNQPSKKPTPKVQKCFALVAPRKEDDQLEIIFTSKFRTGCVDKSLDTDIRDTFIAKLSSDTDTYQDGWIKKFNETRNANIKWNKANGY